MMFHQKKVPVARIDGAQSPEAVLLQTVEAIRGFAGRAALAEAEEEGDGAAAAAAAAPV